MTASGGPKAAGTDMAAIAAGFPNPAYAWFVVFALAFTNMMSYVERLLLTLLFGPIKADFQLSDTEISLLQGAAFVIFYVAFGLVVGRLADRANRKWIITIGIVFWSLATVFCGLARNFVQLFIARISVGVGEATLGPSAYSLMSDYFPKERLTRAISVFTGSQYLGAGLALMFGGFAIHIVSQIEPWTSPFGGALAPWQMTFVLVGLCGLAVLIPMLFVKEPARRGVVPVEGKKAGKAVSFGEVWGFLKQNRRTIGFIFAGFSLLGIVGFGTVAWLPTYFIRVHGWSPSEIGYVYGAILSLAGGAGVLSGARVIEWLEKRGYRDAHVRMPLFTIPVSGLCQFVVPFIPNPTVALTLVAIFTFLGTLPLSGIMASLQIIVPNQMRGQIIALYLFIANILGTAAGPTVVALFTDYVYRDEMLVGYSLSTTVAIMATVSTLLLYFALRPFRDSLDRAEAWVHVTSE